MYPEQFLRYESWWWTVHGGQCMVDSAWWTVHGGQCMVDSAWWTVHGGQCMVDSAWWTVHGGQHIQSDATSLLDLWPQELKCGRWNVCKCCVNTKVNFNKVIFFNIAKDRHYCMKCVNNIVMIHFVFLTDWHVYYTVNKYFFNIYSLLSPYMLALNTTIKPKKLAN